MREAIAHTLRSAVRCLACAALVATIASPSRAAEAQHACDVQANLSGPTTVLTFFSSGAVVGKTYEMIGDRRMTPYGGNVWTLAAIQAEVPFGTYTSMQIIKTGFLVAVHIKDVTKMGGFGTELLDDGTTSTLTHIGTR